jgi:hypothetical protein
LGDLAIDGKINVTWISDREYESLDWIHLAEDKDQWQDLMHMVMNLQLP